MMTANKTYNDIENHVRNIFIPPDNSTIHITEEKTSHDSDGDAMETTIQITAGRNSSSTYTILKAASDITADDISLLYNSVVNTISKQHPLHFKLFRLFGWWFIFAGALTTFSICPICGQVGCPVGVGTTGIIAGILALVKQHGRETIKAIKKRIISLGSIFRTSKF